MSYSFSVEKAHENYPEIEPLYRQHYAEMQARLAEGGISVPAFRPRLEQYYKASQEGWLINYVVRDQGGNAVGYSNIYVTNDMHNGDLIAQEDTIFVRKDHRNGVGRRFSKFILDDLRSRGVKRLNVLALTDLRVAKLWERMGFKHTAHAMTYTF